MTLDTSFVILHYFSKEPDVLRKSRNVLHFCRLAGNSGVLPTVVLTEFYAIARRDAGRNVAELRLRELVDSGLEVVQFSQESGVIRAKYHEKIPWGDCFIAGIHISKNADLVLSEDPHFRSIKEIKTRKLGEFKL